MVSTFISLLDIQSWWEIPCIAHFCSLFSSAFNLPDIDIEDLESSLLTDGTEDPVGLLPELIVCLLKGCDALKNRNEITTSNYQMFLRRFLRQQCRLYNTKNYFDTDIDFQSLPLRNKLLILYSLCHFRLESSNVQTILANLEADSLRVEPLGYDSKNSGYWYFYGTRLYREDTKPGGKSTVWQVICFTEEDWSNLASKFKNSTSPKERALYKILTENFIPKLPQLFRERERLRRRKLLQVRNSARIHNIVEEKQRILEQKKEAEEVQRQKHDEELKLQAANKSRIRTRRRSQSSSTASGISTYASSIRASTPSSEFFTHHETFCLSPELGGVDGESISPKYNPITYNKDKGCTSIKEITAYITCKEDQLPSIKGECEQYQKEDEEKGSTRINVYHSEDCDVEENSINSIVCKQRKPRNKVSVCIAKETKNNRSTSCDRETVSTLPERWEAMAPTSNVKLPGRQTNNSLSSIPENIFLSSVFSNSKQSKNNKSKSNKSSSANSKSKEKDKKEGKKEIVEVTADNNSVSQKKKKNKGTETYTEKDEILQIGMHKVLLYVKNHRDAWPFMDPVDEEIAPRYYSIIRRPMDLLKMEEKLDNEEYKKYSEFRNDFKLIVNNCRLYNGQNNEYTEMVNNLQEAFDKATKKYLDQHSSDEDESFEYPDPRSNVFREKSFNKSIACKVAQPEEDRHAEQKSKENVQSTSQNESEEPDEEDEEKSSENRSGKKKRKDKDKRRKKKSKAKTHTKAVELEDVDHLKEHSENENDAASNAVNKNKKRPTERIKSKIAEPPPKRMKTKAQSEGEPCQQDIPDKRHKKIAKPSSKPSMKAKEKDCSDDENKDDRLECGAEVIPDSDQVGKIASRPRKTSRRKHSPGTEKTSIGKRSPVAISKDIPVCVKIDKQEKSNLNSKSRSAKLVSTTVAKGTVKKDNVKASKIQQAKDNKINSPGTTKKRKGRKRRAEEVKAQDEKINDGNRTNSVGSDVNEESLSRSSSPPLFKVDLHEKYAKSASIKDEESSCDIIKGNRESPVINLPAKVNPDEELMSITSQSLSRSASPFNSFESDATESEKSKLTAATRAHEKTIDIPTEEFEKSTSSTTNQSPPSTTSSYFYLDKYDLIKQRRNRNTEEKWNQIVKEAEKMKDTKKATLNKSSGSESSKEKNQKLKETIEKLKLKNAKSKERSVLIDEIFGVKPTQQPRDEKTIFEKLRDSCPDSKSPPTGKKIITSTSSTTPAQPVKEAVPDAYDFVDDLVPPKPVVNKKPVQPNEKPVPTSKKILPKKDQIVKAGTKKPPVISNKTNLEALELETEQTLKDINRWLEHTPRFPEFSSASNSPSRYNLLDDFDAVASKIDPNDFRRPVSLAVAKLEPVGIDEIADSNKQEIIEDLIPPLPVTPAPGTAGAGTPISGGSTTNSSLSAAAKPREPSGTTQFLAHPPPPPHVKNQQQKETKRKTLKEKLTGVSRRKDLLRTIDRLQPGKAKGNLIGAISSNAKAEEVLPVVAVNKIKEVKNSLVVKTDESGPKLSMGSVLQTEGFGLGQLHSFTDSNSENKSKEDISTCDKPSIDEPPEEKEEAKKEEAGIPKCVEIEKTSQKMEKFTATPNLSAWFKAFGTPKKAKKAEEDEKKAAEAAAAAVADTFQSSTDRPNTDQATNNSTLNTMKSPPTSIADTFSLPAPRQRKASTGSTVSERSSFSQDPDSPRVGIEDRFGAYTGPYPSPIGASPIMVSPKPDEIGKPTSPYPLNGAIKVGFYQDTTTKSSPEKSCSPRELPSPYPQYSQHLYSTASSPTVNTDAANTYGSYNSNSDANKSQVYSTTPASTLFEQYKQPRSQESDYNSMSPNTNSNSPYQQPQNSPYQQAQSSPYQQQSSPYQQAQNSPFQNQSNASNVIGSSPNSPNMPQTPQQSQSESPRSQANSPYHQQNNSPYQQPTSSPYNQNSTPPYQAAPPQQGQQSNIGFMTQQQSIPAQNNQAPAESVQRQAATNSLPYQTEPPTYSMHEASTPTQYQVANRNSMAEFESNIPKRNTNAPNMLDKMQQNADWNSQMDLTIPHSHQSERHPVAMPTLNSISHAPTQLNTPPLQNDQLNQLQTDKTASMQYSHYPQFGGNSQKDTSKPANMFVGDMTMDMSAGLQRQQQDKGIPQSQQQVHLKASQHDSNIMNLGGYADASSRQEKHQQGQEQITEKGQYDSLQKHQQMFDSFLGSMTGNKNLGIGKSMDIPTSKAFEMFNRASVMGFSKEYANPLSSGHQKAIGATAVPNVNQSQMQQAFHIQPTGGKNMNPPPANNMAQVSNKPLNMASNNYQPIQQHLSDSVASKMSTFPTPMSDPANDINKLHQHTSAQQLTATNYSSSEKMSNEVMMASNTRQEAMSQVSRNQQLNMELAGYKTYNNPASMLDPLRNLNHPLAMMDDSLLGLSGSSAPSGYYEKNIPPAAHMFSKNLSQQMYSNASPYGAPPRDQQIVPNTYGSSASSSINPPQPMENFEGKQTKRKKKKAAAPVSVPTEIVPNPASMLPNQQVLQAQSLQSAQGFQLYSDLKTASGSVGTDASAISLKTASSMVPGSAFNFGPTPAGLGLSAGMYGDNTGYLDPYYLPSSHRTTGDAANEKANSSAAVPTPAAPYQFLAHNPVRPTYPFMNSQLDPNSPIYQQYIQRQEQELRARMMINQGLLGSTAGTAGSYGQPGYRPATLGMPKHYDMSRQTWF